MGEYGEALSARGAGAAEVSVRIAGGVFAGRVLFGPERGKMGGHQGRRGLRPSGARLRKSLFEVLAPELRGVAVLDVCAGVGTLGFEALSRGAAHCVFLERNRRMCRLIAKNAGRLGLEAVTLLPGEAALRLGRLAASGREFRVVLCDPPWQDWESGLGMRVFEAALRLRPRTAVCEHPARFSPPRANLPECRRSVPPHPHPHRRAGGVFAVPQGTGSQKTVHTGFLTKKHTVSSRERRLSSANWG